MEGLEGIIYMLDEVLNTRRKRHITGGILVSISMLFGGLALTVMTLKNEDERENKKEAYNDEQIY
ncbi:MAG: histidine kinase [bacterium]|nr:histidine kinase [bacterium]